MKNLFIDTNIWLQLYNFTSDDLEQFNKLKNYIGKEIKLFVPQQVEDEIRRNRELKLKETFKTFEIQAVQYPAFCKGYEEYDSFKKDYDNILRCYKKWKKKIDKDIICENLPADITIRNLFELSGTIPCEEFVDFAYMRYRIGNPPGKDNKYGDAINWECLLNEVPDGEDIYLISADKDYRSQFSDDLFNPFLRNEWKERKKSEIIFYRNLVTFLNEHVKDIQLKTELEKQELIKRLSQSRNFETTHGVIAMLNKHTGWSDSQIEELCDIVENNNQVGWILADSDIVKFYSKLLDRIKYGELQDCATKRILEMVDSFTHDVEEETREDYEGERADALENYYFH